MFFQIRREIDVTWWVVFRFWPTTVSPQNKKFRSWIKKIVIRIFLDCGALIRLPSLKIRIKARWARTFFSWTSPFLPCWESGTGKKLLEEFFNSPTPASFSFFSSFLSTVQKIDCLLDSNSDHQSGRRGHWPYLLLFWLVFLAFQRHGIVAE